jgi:hypothetical protein
VKVLVLGGSGQGMFEYSSRKLFDKRAVKVLVLGGSGQGVFEYPSRRLFDKRALRPSPIK